jgi:hypothetical protein
MTCAHILGLIDAGPFADYPHAHLEAAWLHARQCATCGPALEAATALTADLVALPSLAPPPDMAAAVLKRIAQIEESHGAVVAAGMPETGAPSSTSDWSAWATALGGLGVGFAIVSAPLGDAAPIEIAMPGIRGITAGLIAMPSTTMGTLVLAAGLVLYVAGLFGPLGNRSQP